MTKQIYVSVLVLYYLLTLPEKRLHRKICRRETNYLTVYVRSFAKSRLSKPCMLIKTMYHNPWGQHLGQNPALQNHLPKAPEPSKHFIRQTTDVDKYMGSVCEPWPSRCARTRCGFVGIHAAPAEAGMFVSCVQGSHDLGCPSCPTRICIWIVFRYEIPPCCNIVCMSTRTASFHI